MKNLRRVVVMVLLTTGALMENNEHKVREFIVDRRSGAV